MASLWSALLPSIAVNSRYPVLCPTLPPPCASFVCVCACLIGVGAARCTSAYTTKHSLFLTLDKHTHLRLRKFDPDPQDFADYFRFFRSLDVFSTLTTPQLARLTYGAKEWTATRGTIVAREGVLTPSIIFVRSGSCKVSAHATTIPPRL